jgi:hypothetical protein
MPEIHRKRLALRYRSGAANIRDLQTEISSALKELGDPDSEIAYAASDFGLASDEFAQAEGSVNQEGKGFGDAIILIAIFAPAGNHALRNVWDDLIWPRIKSRLGADAIGDEVYEDDSDQDDSDQDAEK